MRVSTISVTQPINNYRFNNANLKYNYVENTNIAYKGVKGIAVGGGLFGSVTTILVGAASSFTNIVPMAIAGAVAAILGGAFGHSVQQFNIEDKKNLERQDTTKMNR